MATLDCLPRPAAGTTAMDEWCTRNGLDPATTLANIDVQPMADGRWLLTYQVLEDGLAGAERTKIVDEHPPIRPPHEWVEDTNYGDHERHYVCAGCGAHKTEPYNACES